MEETKLEIMKGLTELRDKTTDPITKNLLRRTIQRIHTLEQTIYEAKTVAKILQDRLVYKEKDK